MQSWRKLAVDLALLAGCGVGLSAPGLSGVPSSALAGWLSLIAGEAAEEWTQAIGTSGRKGTRA